jgi:predicted ArsR family transcriptional regulator
VRAELLEVLAMHESLTATHAGELIGESPTTCSFHLRQLAKYGFVEEAVKGKGRQRPWRLVNRMLTISSEGLEPEASVAADVLTAMIVQRALHRFDTWLQIRRSFSSEWREASNITQQVSFVTAAELEQINTMILAMFDRCVIVNGLLIQVDGHRVPLP